MGGTARRHSSRTVARIFGAPAQCAGRTARPGHPGNGKVLRIAHLGSAGFRPITSPTEVGDQRSHGGSVFTASRLPFLISCWTDAPLRLGLTEHSLANANLKPCVETPATALHAPLQVT